MKKILLLLSIFICVGVNAQDFYRRPQKHYLYNYDGSTASYQYAITLFDLNPNECTYDFATGNAKFKGINVYPGNVMYKGIGDQVVQMAPDNDFFNSWFSESLHGMLPVAVFNDSTYSDPAWLTSLHWNKITNKPSLLTTSYVPSWSSVSGKPIFSPIATSGLWADIVSKPLFASVATSGAYSDLSGRPTSLSQFTNDLTFNPSWASITGKPAFATVSTSGLYNDLSGKPIFATVATSGNYLDLSNKPTIPAAQVNSDWNATSGLAQILNKPTLKRQETYTGTTNGSGNYTITFSTSYSVAPNIQANLVGNNTNQFARVTAVSTTGFTVNVYSFNSLSIAGIVALLPTVTNVSGASADVLITEK